MKDDNENIGIMRQDFRTICRQLRVYQGNASELQMSDILRTIIRVYCQYKNLFGNRTRESIVNRVVSISKPYIILIVRDNETKELSFGQGVTTY